MKNTYTVTLDGVEYDVDVVVEADMSYQAARTWGPPEDCYPADSECDITSIEVLTEVPGYTPEQVAAALQDKYADTLEEDLWEDYRDSAAAQRESYYASRCDEY